MLLIFNNVLFLKILNCVFSTVITFLIYVIIKKITSEDTARIISLVYAIALYPIYLNSILGNQQLGLMLFLIGIYVLLTKKNTIINGIIVGILFALGNLERPEGIIYITTLIVYNIVVSKKIKEFLKNTLPVIVTYFIVTWFASFILIATGVNKVGFKNTDPNWKFILGFSYEYKGKFNSPDYDSFAMKPEISKKEVLNRISQTGKIPKLMYDKIKIQWLYDDLDQTFHATSTKQFSQGIVQIMVKYIKVMNLFVLILAFIGLIKNKNIDKINYFFIINVMVYFAVYLLIEVCARYYYNPQVDLIILSALGIERLKSLRQKS